MRIYIIFFLLILTILESCAVRPPLNYETNDPSTGVLIGSFSRVNGKPRFNQYSFYFIGPDGTEREITIKPELITTVKYPDDFDNGEVSGSLFAFTLPAGNYTFKRYYNLYQVTISAYRGFVPSDNFEIPFSIEPGTVNYIGEIRFYPKLKDKYESEPKFFLGNYADGGFYRIHNSYERDMPLLKKKFKSLESAEILNITPLNVEIPVLKEEK